MPELLKFEFRRIFKSVFFRIVVGYCVVWPLLATAVYRLAIGFVMKESGLTFADFILTASEHRRLTWLVSIAFINELPKFIALFTCLHIGSDFSSGVVRNKIIGGHSRTEIFFSYLITQIAATVAFSVIYIGFAFLGLLITGFGVDINRGEMLVRFLAGIMTLLVFTVFFVAMSLVFKKRALPIIFSIIIVMTMSTATAVVGSYNIPSNAVDDYIARRHVVYEEMVQEGYLTKDDVRELEKDFNRDSYLGLPWKLCHPVYVVSTLGFSGDYGCDFMTLLTDDLTYDEELDFSETITNGIMSFNYDYSGLSPQDFKKTESMHVKYSTLNLIYIGKSLAWMIATAGSSYFVFRKRNLF